MERSLKGNVLKETFLREAGLARALREGFPYQWDKSKKYPKENLVRAAVVVRLEVRLVVVMAIIVVLVVLMAILAKASTYSSSSPP